jgi:hypothetical protein
MTPLETPHDAALRSARATMAAPADASDGDILRACGTLIEHGTPEEKALAQDMRTLIEGEVEDDGFITVHPPMGRPRNHAEEIANLRATLDREGVAP